MNKELIVNVPDGYEIDKKLSTFEKIVFKKIPEPEVDNWMDTFKERPIDGFYINSYSNIRSISTYRCSGGTMKNTFPTMEMAKKSLAMSQLSMLMCDMYNKKENGENFAIILNNGEIRITPLFEKPMSALLESLDDIIDQMLFFDSLCDAETFLAKNRGLIKDYFLIKD